MSPIHEYVRNETRRQFFSRGANAVGWAATPDGDPRDLYTVGLNTTRLLMAFGDVVCGWLLLRGAEVALDRLNGDLAESEQRFYEGKVASARWFARTVLPKLAAERAIAEATDLAVMDLPEAAF